MSVETLSEETLAAFDWHGAGLKDPERWPRSLHTAIVFCLAWPGVGIAVFGERPVVVCNLAASRRFSIRTPTPLEDAAERLGPELMELVAHGLAGGVGRSDFRSAREYMVAPLMEPSGGFGALVLSTSSAALEQEHAHRMRNLLARLRSIAAHSAETAFSVEDYAAHLDGRISAAGRAQTSIALDGGPPADLETLLRDELIFQAAREGGDYSVEGADIDLPAHATEVVVLALHELATNAVKFGAFAQKSGFLSVSWRLEPRIGGDWLIIEWVEQGVTMATQTPREGFGMALIRHRLPYELQGETAFEFRPGGIYARLAFPMSAVERH